jgi:MFS family permease
MEHLLSSEQAAVSSLGWRPRATLALLMGYFGFFGMLIGADGVIWAEVVLALQLNKATFGTVQLVAPLLAVGLLLVSGRLCAWAGKKRVVLAGLALLSVSRLALAGAGNLWGVVGMLLLTGAGAALLEAGMNAATLDWEQTTGRSVMSAMHAGFSGGAVLGALGAGALLELGWSYGQVLVLLSALFGLMIIVTLPARDPPAGAGTSGEATPMLRLLVGRPLLVALALIGVVGVVGESVANVWSVIYLRELGAQSFVGGVAFALFNGAMFVGRLVNAPLVARLGSRASLLVSGAGLVLATLLLILPGGVSMAVTAFIVLGFAVAGVIPTALSAAARLAPGNSGAITGMFMAAAYTGFIFCPPLIGWLAELVSLRAALLTVGLSGLLVLWLARDLRDV